MDRPSNKGLDALLGHLLAGMPDDAQGRFRDAIKRPVVTLGQPLRASRTFGQGKPIKRRKKK